MTYGQLAKIIEKMSEQQRQMPVIVLADEFIEISLMLHVDEDMREEQGFAEDQPILT